MRGNGYFPVTGGLFIGDDAAQAISATSGAFPVSQDQRNTVRTRWRYDINKRVWMAVGATYDTGLPIDFEGTYQEAAAQYGLAILNRVNFSNYRPRRLFSLDFSVGVVLRNKEKHAVRLQIDGTNLTNEIKCDRFRGVVFRWRSAFRAAWMRDCHSNFRMEGGLQAARGLSPARSAGTGYTEENYVARNAMSDIPVDSTLEFRPLAAAVREKRGRQHPEEETTELFSQWRGALLRYLATFGLAAHDREEIVQEVFLSLFSHLQQDKARTNLRGWLFRVTHNLALKHRIAERKTNAPAAGTAALENFPHPALNPEEELANSQRLRRLSSILHVLPEQDRRCLYLRAEGLRYREIAEVLGMSLGSVSESLARSLARFARADQR
ncbi:MAG TPA: sigma-70 family RNA polymerase sigma factor [Bryobacteraceae bacterium]|jgi:RNA polymerase sigma-70 factor (ECF subfamily)|nr:sigma-70 family RNA polymerase sigma factor [Bryobacteraceae bacterium]